MGRVATIEDAIKIAGCYSTVMMFGLTACGGNDEQNNAGSTQQTMESQPAATEAPAATPEATEEPAATEG